MNRKVIACFTVLLIIFQVVAIPFASACSGAGDDTDWSNGLSVHAWHADIDCGDHAKTQNASGAHQEKSDSAGRCHCVHMGTHAQVAESCVSIMKLFVQLEALSGETEGSRLRRSIGRFVPTAKLSKFPARTRNWRRPHRPAARLAFPSEQDHDNNQRFGFHWPGRRHYAQPAAGRLRWRQQRRLARFSAATRKRRHGFAGDSHDTRRRNDARSLEGHHSSTTTGQTTSVVALTGTDGHSVWMTTDGRVWSGQLPQHGNHFDAAFAGHMYDGSHFPDGTNHGPASMMIDHHSSSATSGRYARSGDAGTFSMNQSPMWDRPATLGKPSPVSTRGPPRAATR